MVAKLLKRLAGRSASTGGAGESLDGQLPNLELQDRSGMMENSLPSAWVKMHVWRRDHGKCVLCGGHERVWFDYTVPVLQGGSNTEQNMRLICENCRRNKSVQIRRKKLGH
jgi:HNH endonuclease